MAQDLTTLGHDRMTINMMLYGSQEFHDTVAVLLTELIELRGSVVSLTVLTVGMPHDSLNLVACPTVVQSVFSAGVGQRQPASP